MKKMKILIGILLAATVLSGCNVTLRPARYYSTYRYSPPVYTCPPVIYRRPVRVYPVVTPTYYTPYRSVYRRSPQWLSQNGIRTICR